MGLTSVSSASNVGDTLSRSVATHHALIGALMVTISHCRFGFGLSNPYLAAGAAAQGGKFPDLTVTQRAAFNWPGIQGLMSNPSMWRDRFVLNSKSRFLISKLNRVVLFSSFNFF